MMMAEQWQSNDRAVTDKAVVNSPIMRTIGILAGILTGDTTLVDSLDLPIGGRGLVPFMSLVPSRLIGEPVKVVRKVQTV